MRRVTFKVNLTHVDIKHPELTLDEQIEKAREMEGTVYGWNLINSVLCKVLNRGEREIAIQFKPLWDDLNKYVHPSVKQMDLAAAEDFSSLVTDSFSEGLARRLLRATDEMFDVAYMIVLKKFSKARDLALEYEFMDEWEDHLPNTVAIITQ